MSDKKRTSITIDEEVYEYLKQSEINQSGLINELVKEYKRNDKRRVAALETRYQELIGDAEEAAARAERKYAEAEEVQELLEEARKGNVNGIEAATDALSEIPDERLTPENPAVQNWADKLGITATQLVQQLQSNT
jgi:post-segregation antitoxin (ccd killing protein)